jgi:excisionase family DNA binding protein
MAAMRARRPSAMGGRRNFAGSGDSVEYQDLPQKTLLRPDEVAIFLSVSLKTVYRWYRSGLIDGTKVKRSLRIFRTSVLRLVDGDETVERFRPQ